MIASPPLPPLEALKAQAKRLRASLEESGQAVSHSQALELIARQYGFRDWNTLHARLGNQAPVCPVFPGSRVRGTYLKQPFEGTVLGVQTLSAGRYRLSVDFDEAVDVVTFESFSAFRKRVYCTIGPDGVTAEKTSDGEPHMRLHLY